MFADEGGIYRHRWSDQSTFPFVLGAFNAKVGNIGGECQEMVCVGSQGGQQFNPFQSLFRFP